MGTIDQCLSKKNKQATTRLKAKVSAAWSISSPAVSKDKQVQGALKRHEDYGHVPWIGEFT